MSKKKQTLCAYKKDEIKENLKELSRIVSDPKFICRKCARVANDKEYLCKPAKLK